MTDFHSPSNITEARSILRKKFPGSKLKEMDEFLFSYPVMMQAIRLLNSNSLWMIFEEPPKEVATNE